MADLKNLLKDLTAKTAKTQEIDKAAAEKVARAIQAAKATAKIPSGKKA